MLDDHIKYHESLGCSKRNLGIVKMQPGYALMLNADQSHYYWLRSDGSESSIHHNRFHVYNWAVQDSKKGNAANA